MTKIILVVLLSLGATMATAEECVRNIIPNRGTIYLRTGPEWPDYASAIMVSYGERACAKRIVSVMQYRKAELRRHPVVSGMICTVGGWYQTDVRRAISYANWELVIKDKHQVCEPKPNRTARELVR